MSDKVLDIDVLIRSQVDDAWAIPILAEIRQLCKQLKIKIVVLDDDPTGTQTVYNIPVITKWHDELIADTLKTSDRGFFILTNSRSLSEKEAVVINTVIAQRVKAAADEAGFSALLISRSDSTLRGHFPAELLALEKGWDSSWDGYILMPYFKEGGRYTIHDIHYVRQKNQLIPVAKTGFAKDPVFNYNSSDLAYYISEKTNYQVNISEIIAVTIEQLNTGVKVIEQQLDKLLNGKYAIVNATCSYHAAFFALGVVRKWQTGRGYLVRCSASLVQAFFGIAESKFPGMAYIIIPGNIGTEDCLTILYNKLQNAAA